MNFAFRDLLHAVNLRHGTNSFTSLPKEGVLIFALKNPTASAGFEPANLGTKGQHATPRPSKPPAPSVRTTGLHHTLKKQFPHGNEEFPAASSYGSLSPPD